MLEAVAGRALLERSYSEALRRGYLWHEFGDSHLIAGRAAPARLVGRRSDRPVGLLSELPGSSA